TRGASSSIARSSRSPRATRPWPSPRTTSPRRGPTIRSTSDPCPAKECCTSSTPIFTSWQASARGARRASRICSLRNYPRRPPYENLRLADTPGILGEQGHLDIPGLDRLRVDARRPVRQDRSRGPGLAGAKSRDGRHGIVCVRHFLRGDGDLLRLVPARLPERRSE